MTREAIELGFILKQIDYGRFSMDTLQDRLRLQKTVYLMQAFGLNLGYDFAWYLKGPYCTTLATNGFILAKVYDELPCSKIRFVSGKQQDFEDFQRFIKYKNGDDLETAASIHYLKNTENDPNDDHVIAELMKKPGTVFSKDRIWSILKEMKEIRLIKMTGDSHEECRQNRSTIRTYADTAFYHMLVDSRENDEDLEPLKKPIFDTDKPIDRTDAKASFIVKTLYSPKITEL